MTEEMIVINERFNELLNKAKDEAKKTAVKIEELPKYASETDKICYDALLALFARYYSGKLTSENLHILGGQLRVYYINRVRQAVWQQKIVEKDQERYMTGTQTIVKLNNEADILSEAEILNMGIILIKKYFNEVTGNIIEEKLKKRGLIE